MQLHRRFFSSARFYFFLSSGLLATTLASMTLFPTFSATICGLFLARIKLRLLLGGQNRANLRELLSVEGLAALHYLAGLKHVAAERSGIAFLASSASRFHEGRGLGAERLV